MTKIKNTPAAQANRLAIGDLLTPRPAIEPARNFDELGLTDEQLIAELGRRHWWGNLAKGQPGETRGIEVRR